jgi:AcrR family transcriptional regulator
MGKHRDDSERARRAVMTRERIVAAAADLFAAAGYSATSLDQICAAANVTKGALYHHFDDKRAVFLAVYESALAELAARVQEIGDAGLGVDRVDVFADGCVWFVERAAADQRMVRLLITEGRVAFGDSVWRDLDDRFTSAEIERRMVALQARGLLRGDVDMAAMAQLLNAAINEAALRVVLADDRDGELARAVPALRALIGGLRAG